MIGTDIMEKLTLMECRHLLSALSQLDHRSICPVCQQDIAYDPQPLIQFLKDRIEKLEYINQQMQPSFEEQMRLGAIKDHEKRALTEQAQVYLNNNFSVFKQLILKYKKTCIITLPQIPENLKSVFNKAMAIFLDCPSRCDFLDEEVFYYVI